LQPCYQPCKIDLHIGKDIPVVKKLASAEEVTRSALRGAKTLLTSPIHNEFFIWGPNLSSISSERNIHYHSEKHPPWGPKKEIYSCTGYFNNFLPSRACFSR